MSKGQFSKRKSVRSNSSFKSIRLFCNKNKCLNRGMHNSNSRWFKRTKTRIKSLIGKRANNKTTLIKNARNKRNTTKSKKIILSV